MMWLMLQQKGVPKDYVIASGMQTSVRSFVELCSKSLGWGGIIWEGKDLNEIGRRKDTNSIVIKIDKRYYRPTEVDSLLGDASKEKDLGWIPKTSLKDLVDEMISNDLEEAKKIPTKNETQILLTGSGMVGRNIVENGEKNKYQLITPSKIELNLLNLRTLENF